MAEATMNAAIGVASGAKATPKQIAAVVAGNSLEFYDFLIYAYFAVYIGQAFFPSDNPSASLMASLATFGAGFVTRPLGAIVIGRFADRVGRKPAMVLSFGLMGFAILGLALTPAYAAIGVAAPVLAIVFRLLQGFALGGELGPSTSFLIEAAPPHRRGLYVSFQYVGQSVATLCAGLIGVALASFMDDAALRDYGWRIAMLVGVVIVPVGLMLRRNLSETLHAADPLDDSAAVGIRPYLKIALLAIVMMAAGTSVSYVLKYMSTYAIATLHMPAQLAFTGTVIGGIVGICVNPLGGWLSDRFGRKPVMLWPWIFLLVAIFPCFYAISETRSAWVLFACTALMGGVGAIAAASVLASITESLPKRVRSGGLALIYALAISIFGGTAQFNVAWLTSLTGSPLAPGWYMMAGVGLGLMAMLALAETAPVKTGKVAMGS